MRHLLGWVWWVVWCVSLVAGDLRPLRQLEDTDRIFELRRALEQPRWDAAETLFYRAVIAARFGHEPAAIDDFREFIAGRDVDREMKRKAYEELASALVRVGRYREAARAWTEALHLTPDDEDGRADNENTQALYEALGEVAPQTVAFGDDLPIQATRNRLGSWNVPVEVKGHRGEWIFDTGANWSTLTESEAVKMGLRIRNAETYVRGSTGNKNQLRLAVADNLQFGGAHLKNVVFLVLADKALFIGPLKYQITGILGLPVIRALERVGISAKGVVRIEAKEPVAQAEPNVFFHELTPIVEIHHRDHRLQMFFDSGANASFIYPSFRSALGNDEIASLRRKREKTAGAGGTIKRRTEFIPKLRLEVLGRVVELTRVSLLPTQPGGDLRYRDGVLAMDSVASGFTLDFRTMQLRVE